MLVGGFYVCDIPVWIGWLKYLSFVYWGFNLLLKIQFAGVTFYTCQGPVCQPVPSLQDALILPTDPNEPVYPEVLVLLAMLVILRAAVYVVLRKKTATRPLQA